ncbi:MFS transporter, partial [Sutterella massiliensis]
LTPFMMLAGGFVNDRFGPKWVIGAGGAVLGAGYLLTAVAGSTFELYCTYGIFIGIGTGLVNGCTINTAVKYFPEHRGAAGGIVTASLGIGAAVLPFAAQSLISAWGVDAALRSFGLVSA